VFTPYSILLFLFHLKIYELELLTHSLPAISPLAQASLTNIEDRSTYTATEICASEHHFWLVQDDSLLLAQSLIRCLCVSALLGRYLFNKKRAAWMVELPVAGEILANLDQVMRGLCRAWYWQSYCAHFYQHLWK